MQASNRVIHEKLQALRTDFLNATGSTFQSFYCPLLLRDEAVPLCKAHVVNQALADASDAWTVQRQDVDNFYGSATEAAFTKLEIARNWETFRALVDRSLRTQLCPKITVNARAIEFYIPSGPVPEGFSTVKLCSDGETHELALKISPAELSSVLDGEWHIEIALDLRGPALASLIKSAFLTAFELGGYAYALSPAGRSVGAEILGRFFIESRNLSRVQKLERLVEFFEPYSRMLRPVLSEEPGLQGTVDDGKALVCWSNLGFHWGIIVFVRAAGLHSVLLPLEGGDQVQLAYQHFLQGNDEEIEVRSAQFDRGVAGSWRLTPTTDVVVWPRS